MCRTTLAKLLWPRGDQERALTLLKANLQMLRNVPPKTGLRRSSRLSETLEESIRVLSEPERGSNTNWAHRLVEFLHFSRNKLKGLDVMQDSEVEYLFQDSLLQEGRARRTGKLDDARRTADRMIAFARQLVSMHPDQPIAHLATSLAFEQFAKNAWQTNDRFAVEKNWELALEAARQELHLNPGDLRARDREAVLQRRLDALRAPSKNPGNPHEKRTVADEGLLEMIGQEPRRASTVSMNASPSRTTRI